MLTQVSWSEDRSYRTGSKDKPIQFYMDGLCNSQRFDLLLGYFSSAAINVLSYGFATFLFAGGKVRMVVNNILSQADRDAVKTAKEGEVEEGLLNLADIGQLKNSLNEYNKHFFECLAWLIANDRIQLKIIKPKSGQGIAHYKSGTFSDGTNTVGFKASCNFTAFGLLENLEEIDAFLSWENSRSSKMINRQNTDFEEIFSGKADFVEYLEVANIAIAIKNEFGDKSLNELIIQEKELIEKKNKALEDKKLKKSFEKIADRIEELIKEPRFPFNAAPRPYQMEAYSNWANNHYQGIFAMATGTGKTITSLNCLLQETNKVADKTYHALVLVPTITLVNQWAEEAKGFNFREIIKVSSKEKWENELATTLSTAKRIATSFLIITTYASFTKARFQKYLKELPPDTLLIADEAHNIGSPNVAAKLSVVPLQKRIGLSATPKRVYDPAGSTAMENFFNDQPPYTYAFSMERAIEEGILCNYYYCPHIVRLTAEELIAYAEITKKLAKFYNKESGEMEGNSIVEMLLLKRKRIVHKAENKLATTKQILEERFKKDGNLRYTFIYVPEGLTTESEEEETDDEDTINIINQYTREIGRIDNSITVNQFTSGMADRNEVLNQFKDGRIQVIASMKCLDEGVDIPRAEHAIFCSSTGNPRQFIQRRGRILRKHPDKNIAVIHDLVVVPDFSISSRNSDTYKTERSLVEKELERVMYFASLAINPFDTEKVFEEVCQHYDLNIYTIQNKLKSDVERRNP